MLKAGAYKEMDICMMCHPTPQNGFAPMFARAMGSYDFEGHPSVLRTGERSLSLTLALVTGLMLPSHRIKASTHWTPASLRITV